MIGRDELLASIANTIKDYRSGEIPQPTPEHVDRWIWQFGADAQVPMLREIEHVFTQTYFSESSVSEIFASLIDHKGLAGDEPCQFWRSAHLLDVQEHGNSQSEIRQVFGRALKIQCRLEVDDCGLAGGAFVYLDDALFSGRRIGADLSAWIGAEAPRDGIVHVIVIASHQLGEWQCRERLKKAALSAKKDLAFNFWAGVRFENRKKYRDASEVLWPANVPDDLALSAYMAEEQNFPFEPRRPGGRLEHDLFTSEEGRQLLEEQFLLAGMRIRSACHDPSRAMRPLGFSAFGLGFGSTIVTYRNCPNNTPLALWWGDPEAAPGHPFRLWYPLLPRKTYAREVERDELPF